MTPGAIVATLRGRGFQIRATERGTVALAPRERITPEVRALVLENKPALLAYLAGAAEPKAPAARPAPRRSRTRTVYWRGDQVQTLCATVRAQLPAGGQKSHGEALDLALAWLELQHQIQLGDA